MALINCPECGRQVSDQAPTCPECGHPLGPPDAVRHVPPIVVKSGGRGCVWWVGACVVGIVVIFGAFFIWTALEVNRAMSTRALPTSIPLTAAQQNSGVPKSPTAAQKSSEAPVSFSGSSMQQTRPFPLAGGNYTVRWSARPDNTNGSCYHGASLKSASKTTSNTLINESLRGGQSQSGETQVYRVDAGSDYYFDINSGCVWEITIAPL